GDPEFALSCGAQKPLLDFVELGMAVYGNPPQTSMGAVECGDAAAVRLVPLGELHDRLVRCLHEDVGLLFRHLRWRKMHEHLSGLHPGESSEKVFESAPILRLAPLCLDVVAANAEVVCDAEIGDLVQRPASEQHAKLLRERPLLF